MLKLYLNFPIYKFIKYDIQENKIEACIKMVHLFRYSCKFNNYTNIGSVHETEA